MMSSIDPTSPRRIVALAATVFVSLALASPRPAAGQEGTTDTYRLRGESVAVHNVAGRVEVVRGEGEAVRVDLTRSGPDSGRLSVATGVIDGEQTLRVLYPEDRVVYPEAGDDGDMPGFLRWLGVDLESGIEVDEDGRVGNGGRDVEVVSSGDGLRAWADLRIVVPAGQQVAVHAGVGRARLRDVDGTFTVHLASGPVEADGISGPLTVDTGSGSVLATSVRGALDVDTGSGGVRVEEITGPRVRIDTGSGSVDGHGIRADALLVDTGSGGVELRGVSAPELTVDTGSGSVDLTLVSDLDRGEIDTGSGGVEVRVPEDFGARLELDTGSGGIDVELPSRDVSAERGRWRGVVGDGDGTLEVDTGSGGIEIRRG